MPGTVRMEIEVFAVGSEAKDVRHTLTDLRTRGELPARIAPRSGAGLNWSDETIVIPPPGLRFLAAGFNFQLHLPNPNSPVANLTPTNEYLQKVLNQQTFDDDDQELIDLRARRTEIERTLRAHFWKSSPSIKWARSMAKGTMIRESYDGDMTAYFPENETEAGSTLEEIYEAVEDALEANYEVTKGVACSRTPDQSESTTGRISITFNPTNILPVAQKTT